MDELKSTLEGMAKEDIIDTFIEYLNAMGVKPDGDGCPGHNGQCGVCVGTTWIPCG